ncbi:Proton-coupled folate transporter, partial [Stegodyphus mimosarum]
MAPEKGIPSVIIADESTMETVELHRASSMSEPNTQCVKDNVNGQQTDVKRFNVYATIAKNILSEIKQLKIEVIMFLYMFSYIMRSVSSVTLMMEKVCSVHLGYSKKVCSNLSYYEEINVEVERMTNNYHLAHSLIQMLPSAILSCFIGTWSDKYGRKLPILAALLGIILDGLGATICAWFLYSRIEYYLISAIFTGFSGGFISVLTVLYSYASDITTFRKRTMKYALLEVAFGYSLPLGQLAGGLLFRSHGYVIVFMTSTAGHILGLAWVLFVLQETRGLDNNDNWRTKLRQLWSTEAVIASMKATIKKRPNRGREQLLLLILAMSTVVLNLAGSSGIAYMYAHHMYNWDNTTFSTVSSVFSVIGTTSMLIAVPIFKWLKLNDPALGIVGSASILLKGVGTGLATQKWIYYLASLLGLLSGLSTLAGRSRISKVVSKDDLGKVFSFLTSAEAVLPVLATSVISQSFNASLTFYPGLVYLVMGSLCLVPLIIF